MADRFTVFVDKACPACSREVRWLERRDESEALCLVDISARDFDPERDAKTTQLALMRRIHGRTSDGRLVVGVNVFREIYARLGFRRAVRFSKLPVVATLLAAAYEVFAFARFRWAATCTLSEKPLSPEKGPRQKVQVS